MYLQKEHIEFLIQQSKDRVWRMGVTAKFSKKWYDIMALSPAGLIHFQGNSETGFAHIQERHGFYSEKNYFGSGSLRDPSKFSNQSLPLIDYINIADDVYLMRKKDEKKHPDGDLFDKYTGESDRHTGAGGIKKRFVLILYKDTKIVHSLFPDTHIQKPPKRTLKSFARAKSDVKALKFLANDYWRIEIPYEDERHIIRYLIVFYYSQLSKTAKAYIQVNTWNGDPWFSYNQQLCEFPLNMPLPSLFPGGPGNDLEFTRFINSLALYSDLSKIEVNFPRIEEELRNKMEIFMQSEDGMA
jgi:hypothetical protein